MVIIDCNYEKRGTNPTAAEINVIDLWVKYKQKGFWW